MMKVAPFTGFSILKKKKKYWNLQTKFAFHVGKFIEKE